MERIADRAAGAGPDRLDRPAPLRDRRASPARSDWLERTYQGFGIPARRERYGTWRGWRAGTVHMRLIAPRVQTLEVELLAWSPRHATGRPVEGDVVAIPDLADAAAATRGCRRCAGKFVLRVAAGAHVSRAAGARAQRARGDDHAAQRAARRGASQSPRRDSLPWRRRARHAAAAPAQHLRSASTRRASSASARRCGRTAGA